MTAGQEAKLCKVVAVAIRAAMKAQGVGLRELARVSGVSVGTLHHWIGNGTNAGRPRFGVVAAVAVALSVSLDDVVFGFYETKATKKKRRL